MPRRVHLSRLHGNSSTATISTQPGASALRHVTQRHSPWSQTEAMDREWPTWGCSSVCCQLVLIRLADALFWSASQFKRGKKGLLVVIFFFFYYSDFHLLTPSVFSKSKCNFILWSHVERHLQKTAVNYSTLSLNFISTTLNKSFVPVFSQNSLDWFLIAASGARLSFPLCPCFSALLFPRSTCLPLFSLFLPSCLFSELSSGDSTWLCSQQVISTLVVPGWLSLMLTEEAIKPSSSCQLHWRVVRVFFLYI